MTKRIQKAIDIFLDAINNGTLGKGSCRACAVGNLVAHGLGGKVYKTADGFESTIEEINWGKCFSTYNNKQIVCLEYKNYIQNEIKATDFSLEELMQIEYAFETNTKIEYMYYDRYSIQKIKQDQIKGLEAVIKVMLTFDDIKPNNESEYINEVFTSKVLV